jgi:hypothetical protein
MWRKAQRNERRSFVATNLSPVPNAVWLYCCHIISRLSTAASLYNCTCGCIQLHLWLYTAATVAVYNCTCGFIPISSCNAVVLECYFVSFSSSNFIKILRFGGSSSCLLQDYRLRQETCSFRSLGIAVLNSRLKVVCLVYLKTAVVVSETARL